MKVLQKESYIRMIENSVGNKLFNSIIINEEGTVRDLLNDGEFSCARFVSGLLYLQNLIKRTRSAVNTLESDLLRYSNFINVLDSEIKSGDVLIWEMTKYEDGSGNRHVGFAISESEAISTNYIHKCVIRHPINKEIENTGEIRKIEKVFRPQFQE